MKNILLIFIIIFSVILFYWGKEWPIVVFAKLFKINSSSFTEESYKGSRYRLCKPENFTTKSNKEKYPLIVYLHAAGERGKDNRKQIDGLSVLGNGFSKQAKSFQTQHPCFVYVPQCPSDAEWDADTLSVVIETIESLIKEYPIDESRLYLIGYSMGGSGTYALASQYNLATKQIFAAIVRLAGQGSFDKQVHEIIAKSSVWLHIGLQDTKLRIEKAREAYSILKEIHQTAVETTEPINIARHPGSTLTLWVNHTERVKKSEYINDGHSISGFPFEDPALMTWIFRQKNSQ